MSNTTTTKRPSLVRQPSGPMKNVWMVLRRELGARLLTGSYVWSTLIFAAMALFGPLLIPSNAATDAPSIAVTSRANHLIPVLEATGIDIVTTASPDSGESLLTHDTVDALLLPDNDKAGWILLSKTATPDALMNTIQTLLSLDTLQTLARDAGASPNEIQLAIMSTELTTQTIGASNESKWDVLTALGFGLVIIFVILLWGATMAADVVQEKATRVAEILIATIRPWQLLAGKVAALTVIGLMQITVITIAAILGIYFFTHGLDLTTLSVPVILCGLTSVLIGVPQLAALMAAMAARVEHQDDLGAATQPVYLLLMVPFAAAVYASLNDPTGLITQILSLAPLTNIFTMPARVAATPVPGWELALALSVALATLFAAIWLAGRIYAGSILRAGSAVPLREALTSQ